MAYRVLLHKIVTGTLVAEVRPTAARWDLGLNNTGTASITAPTDVLLAALAPLQTHIGSTAVTVVNPAGTPVWSGPIWKAAVNLNNDTTLTCGTMQTLLNRRAVRGSTLTYAATDQATIAASLVDQAQATIFGTRPDRALNITTSPVTLHGVLRDRTYPTDEAKPLGEALAELANVDGGFTYAITPLLGASNSLSHRLDMTYPNTGVSSTAVLIHRSNCLVQSVDMDATSMMSDVFALGGSSTSRIVQRLGAQITGWPCMESVRAWNDVTVAATLTSQANRLLTYGGAPAILPALQVLDLESPVSLNAVVRMSVPEVGLDASYRVTATATTLVGQTAVTTLSVVNQDLYV